MRRGARALLVTIPLTIVAAACGSSESAQPTSSLPPSLTSVPTTTPATVPDAQLSLRYGNLTERRLDVDADGRNTTAAVAAMNAFAIDLYHAVAAHQGGNAVVSPYSVTFALSMVYAGARGQTATEMAHVLHADSIEPAKWHEGLNAYDLTLDARTAGSPTEWRSANKVWAQPRLPLLSDYLDVLTGAYGSPLAEADFGGDLDAARAAINTWIDQQTNELIPELFPPDSLTASTKLVLVNAVAMDAPWEFPFDPAETEQQPFTRADGSTVDVPMMHYNEYLPTLVAPDVQAVEIPYGGGALSMVVIVPTDLAAFEASLTADSLATLIDQIKDGGIHLSLPKWSVRTHVHMNEMLAALGMPTAFSGGADFSGMIEGGGLWLDTVEHEAVVEVDEQGTRAAAATGGAMVASHGPTITVDRPYLYVIRDVGAGTILFIGRVTDPTLTA